MGWTHKIPHQSNPALRSSNPPSVPDHAFFITTRKREASGWTSHAKAEIQKIAAVAGIKHITTIYGEFDPKKFDKRIGELPQGGLAMAHLTIWEKIVNDRLEGAWVFEDDVVAHSNFSALFPLYWSKVPNDYEVVWLGHLPVYVNSVACEKTFPSGRMFHEDIVWCTHAMVLSQAGASRLALGMRGVIETMQHANRIPSKFDLHSDIFMNLVGKWFLPKSERHKWVVFDATQEHLAAWGGYAWCHNTDFYTSAPRNVNGSCCETCHKPSVRSSAVTPVPLMGTGLVYQNLCKKNPWKLEGWRKNAPEEEEETHGVGAAEAKRMMEEDMAEDPEDDDDEYLDFDDDIDEDSELWTQEHRGEL